MYYPYFRGKQYELVTIRENAKLIKEANFIPLIEPVKQSTNSLERAISSILDENGECIVIINPCCGDFYPASANISTFIDETYANHSNLSIGILLTPATTINEVITLINNNLPRNIAIIHSGFEEGNELAKVINNFRNIERHIFIEEHCGKLYRRHFKIEGKERVLLRDGFEKRINRNHPSVERFSDLHVTYEDEEGMDGYGDFLIVGDDYSESGGPAYAIAIHLTYIDAKKDDEMFIHHFISDRKDTPTDPAGKFSEALKKLVNEVEKTDSPILKSKAVEEYVRLYEIGHFPGLGYVKKLSMQHHLETLAKYERER